MKTEYILSLILTAILLIATASLLFSYSQNSSNQQNDPVYVGVAFGGNNTEQAKLLIDKVKTYTNLFILDSGINPISTNQSAVNEICDYATNAGLNIIVNLGTWTNSSDWAWRLQFYNASRTKYGDKFLGVYYDDDVGGVMLDWNWTKQFSENGPLFWGGNDISNYLIDIHYKTQMARITGTQPQNYTDEANLLNKILESNRGLNSLKQNQLTTFTSDYALYWFDYLGGYNTMLTQFGWNNSVNEQISLIRGAATLHNKDWGAIITWKYMQPPYLDTGKNIYNQMVAAYNAGAKYITIFDYPYNSTNPYGILTDDHFQALQQFWDQVVTKSTPSAANARAALVLPNDYGWGMRSPIDKIWGFWGPDSKSPLIWNNTQTLLNKYGLRLDIVYDDSNFPIQGNYSKIYYWNQTIT
jgi:hypothetical protein